MNKLHSITAVHWISIMWVGSTDSVWGCLGYRALFKQHIYDQLN